MDARELDEKLEDLRSKVDEEFVKELKASSKEQMKEKVFQLSKQIEAEDQRKAADAKLRTLKANVSDLNSGYREVKKPIQQKLQLVLLTIQERESNGQ